MKSNESSNGGIEEADEVVSEVELLEEEGLRSRLLDEMIMSETGSIDDVVAEDGFESSPVSPQQTMPTELLEDSAKNAGIDAAYPYS